MSGAETIRKQYERDGFIILPILSASELVEYQGLFARVLETASRVDNSKRHSSSYQHAGDEIADFGKEPRHYYFHILTKPGTEPLHGTYRHPRVLEIVENLLGPRLIVNNASILAANTGTFYKLGWHRDVIQIAESEIGDYLFTEHFHNNVQINLPLYEENCLWVVPGSHVRPNTPAEDAIFQGSKHYSPLDVDMPGGVPVQIPAGHAVFYNNNLLHRGYNERMPQPRRTIHMGYHSAAQPPTWHFYLLNSKLITPEYLETLDPQMRQMLHEYLDCLQQYPRMEDTWRSMPGAPVKPS